MALQRIVAATPVRSRTCIWCFSSLLANSLPQAPRVQCPNSHRPCSLQCHQQPWQRSSRYVRQCSHQRHPIINYWCFIRSHLRPWVPFFDKFAQIWEGSHPLPLIPPAKFVLPVIPVVPIITSSNIMHSLGDADFCSSCISMFCSHAHIFGTRGHCSQCLSFNYPCHQHCLHPSEVM